MTSYPYNLKKIRELLIEGFSEADLRRLCQYEPDFKYIFNTLSKNDSQVEIVDKILSYAERTLNFRSLLAWAKENNPARYDLHQPYEDISYPIKPDNSLSIPSTITIPSPPSPQKRELPRWVLMGGLLFFVLISSGIAALYVEEWPLTQRPLTQTVLEIGTEPQLTLTQTGIAIAEQPSKTPSSTNISLPSRTPTQTDTPIILTSTPSPTLTDSPIFVPPTPTLTNIPTPTVVPTLVIIPDPLVTPTVAILDVPHTVTISPTITLTSSASTGQIVLLEPKDSQVYSNQVTFKWQWQGPALLESQGFEVRVWRKGAPPVGVHNAVEDNLTGKVKILSDNTFQLDIGDVKSSPGVNGGSGLYQWTVVLVRISPKYEDLGNEAIPGSLCIESCGNQSGDGNGGGTGYN